LKSEPRYDNEVLSLSIVIPAFNEDARIGDTIDSIKSFMDNAVADSNLLGKFITSYLITVVDDGSTDSTIKIAREKGVEVIRQEMNKGKGAAVAKGMLEVTGDYKLFSDADLSTPIHEILRLLPELAEKGYDIAIGSRGIDYEKIKKHQPFYREFMGKTFNKIVQALAFKGISDTQCGFKLFTKESAEDIFQRVTVNGFGFDVEVLYLALQRGYKIAEVPVEWHNDERTKVHPILDPLKMLLDVVRLKKTHARVLPK